MPEWASLRFAVIDVEGNGQQPPELAELAVVPIISGTVGDPTTWLVRPKRPITYFATCVHGITKADVVGAPLFEAIAGEVGQALDVPAVVAHNALAQDSFHGAG